MSPARPRRAGFSPAALARAEIAAALLAFAVLCIAVLSVAPQLVEPDDYAYRASIVALTDGHPLTLSSAQVQALAQQLTGVPGPGRNVLTRPGPLGGGIVQWVQLANGRWISEKDPGYPFLAAPFQALGIIRVAPLFFGALACLGLFFGGRRWLGRFGGAAAAGLYCSSGAALLFAWRDYMPTFTDASLIAAGTGALLWAVLAGEAAARRRTWAGLLGFAAIEAAVFVRYTNAVVLACAAVAVLAVRWRQPASLPRNALRCWLGSVVLFGAGVALFDSLVYGGPLRSGYRPGEIRFSLSAIWPNLRYMPAHLMQAMPMLVLGLAGLAVIVARWATLRRTADTPAGHTRTGNTPANRTRTARTPAGHARTGDTVAEQTRVAGTRVAVARCDLAVGLAMGSYWLGIWALYAAYTWTAGPGLSTLQAVRFYLPALGAIALLGAWLLVRLPGRVPLAAAASAAAVTVLFVLGIWAFGGMHTFRLGGGPHLVPHCNIGQPHCSAKPPAARAAPRSAVP